MRPASFLLLSFLLLGSVPPLAGCSGAQERTDPQGRIAFRVPSDWTAAPGSNGTRFHPPGSDAHAVHIQVNTVDRRPRATLEEKRDHWLAQQEKLGEEVLLRTRREAPGFEGVEYAHTVESTAGDGVQHFVVLQRDDYEVSTWLMATDETYETYLPTFQEVVRSIRPAEGG